MDNQRKTHLVECPAEGKLICKEQLLQIFKLIRRSRKDKVFGIEQDNAFLLNLEFKLTPRKVDGIVKEFLSPKGRHKANPVDSGHWQFVPGKNCGAKCRAPTMEHAKRVLGEERSDDRRCYLLECAEGTDVKATIFVYEGRTKGLREERHITFNGRYDDNGGDDGTSVDVGQPPSSEKKQVDSGAFSFEGRPSTSQPSDSGVSSDDIRDTDAEFEKTLRDCRVEMYERLKQDPGSLESIVNDTLSSLGSAASGIWKEVAAMLIGSDNSVADGGNSEEIIDQEERERRQRPNTIVGENQKQQPGAVAATPRPAASPVISPVPVWPAGFIAPSSETMSMSASGSMMCSKAKNKARRMGHRVKSKAQDVGYELDSTLRAISKCLPGHGGSDWSCLQGTDSHGSKWRRGSSDAGRVAECRGEKHTPDSIREQDSVHGAALDGDCLNSLNMRKLQLTDVQQEDPMRDSGNATVPVPVPAAAAAAEREVGEVVSAQGEEATVDDSAKYVLKYMQRSPVQDGTPSERISPLDIGAGVTHGVTRTHVDIACNEMSEHTEPTVRKRAKKIVNMVVEVARTFSNANDAVQGLNSHGETEEVPNMTRDPLQRLE